jgi:hypothetical protein
MKRKIYSFMIAASMVFATSCELDLQVDPNAVQFDAAIPDFLLNSIQLEYQQVFNAISDDGMRLTRIINQGSAQYEGAYTPGTTNPYWTGAYSAVLADIQALEPLAEGLNNQRHLGIAKTIKAMVYMHLVDSYGDVPLTETLQGPDNFNPKVDSGESVYAAAFEALNQADAHFAATVSTGTPNDYFYARNYTKWRRLINTLKLRYFLNTRLVKAAESKAGIDGLIAADNFLKVGDDFIFKFGTTRADPDSRHPRFAGQYTSGGGDYQSTFYMWHLTEAKGFDDPRARYYFYRQVTVNPTNSEEIECIVQIAPPHYLVANFVYCLPGLRGYWGRDHLDPDGLPPDGLKRTAWGVFPAGGRFDNNSGSPVNNPSLGAQGAGIHPIMLAAYVDFMLAESALFLSTAGSPKDLMLSGIRKHMEYVRSWSLSTSQGSVISGFTADAAYATSVTNYLNFVATQYDAAPNASLGLPSKMYVIGREYWLSLYGNGVESYNLYKRTGEPSIMQPGLETNPGKFPRSFFYPLNYLTTNTSAVQKVDQTVQVFWDNNPAGNAWID